MTPARRTRHPARAWVIGLVAAIVGFNLLMLVVDAAVGGPGGPRSSSYSTGPDGLAAYFELLRIEGRQVDQLRTPLQESELDPTWTLVVFDPGDLPEPDARALAGFVRAGGRLVAGGRDPDWLSYLMPEPPTWMDGPLGPVEVIFPAPETAGVTTVEGGLDGAFSDGGGAVPVAGRPPGMAVLVSDQGAGRIVLLADASILHNDGLARADNAALGLALAGEPGRPVVFAESVHGYGAETGLAALPSRWKTAGAVLALAVVVWMFAAGRRVGPPEIAGRPLPPARHRYVTALADTLARTRRPAEAVAPVRAAVRETVARRLRLDPGAPEAEQRQAAAALGLNETEIAAVWSDGGGEASVVSAGRALARLSRHEGSGERGVDAQGT